MSPPGRDPQFVLEHSGYVRELVRRLVFDPELARELEQETWLAALRHDAPSRGSPRSWLATIARNLARRAWRSKARRVERELAAPEQPPSPSPAEILERESLRREVVEALVSLDEPWRETLVLQYLEELPPKAVAERMGVPIRTVRTRTTRGLALLRSKLERRTSLHGAALSLALVETWRLAPPTFAALATSVSSFTAGALLVSTATKSVAAAIAVLALFVVYRLSTQPDPGAPAELRAATEIVVDPVVPHDAEQPSIVGAGSRTALDVQQAPLQPSTEPAVDASRATIVVRATWSSDGSPAADIGFELYATNAVDFYRDATRWRTGPDGTVRIEDVPPGAVSVFCDRGAHGSAKAIAGEVTELALELAEGFQLAGRVLDVDQAVVAGAEVFLWQCIEDPDQGWVVARSDDRGRYSVRGLRAGLNFISARAARRAPTVQRLVWSNEGTTVELDLVFEHVGGAVRGRVLDELGQPLPGATVVVGGEAGFGLRRLPDGVEGRAPAGHRVATGGDGEFAVECAPAGTVRVQSRAPGFVLWSDEVEVPQGGSRWIEIRLSRGAKLEGVVRDESGAPVARAEVSLDGASSLGGAHRRTASDGNFSIEGLGAGTVQLRVEHARFVPVTRELTILEGESARVDLVLSNALSLRISVEGSPADWAGGFVRATAKNDLGFGSSARIDESGLALLERCSEQPMRIELLAPEDHMFPRAVVEDVLASAGELVIRPDASRTGHVRLAGRIVDVHGNPVATAQITPTLRGAAMAPIEGCDGDSGRFAVGPYSPGAWSIFAQASGFVDARTSWVELAAGQTHDFGDIVVHRGGKLAIVGLRTKKAMIAELGGVDGTRQPLAAVDGRWFSEWIPAGRYWLVTGGGEVALEARQVEVLAGEVQEVRIVERIVEPRRLRRATTLESGASGVEIRDSSGVSLGTFAFDGEHGTARMPLATGRYEVRVLARERELGRRTLEVTDELSVETIELQIE